MNSGIYKIINKINSRSYIGSSVCIETRWKVHKNLLTKNVHWNDHLQRAWNKYGEENFSFEVIEEVLDRTRLLDREQHYLDNEKHKYNFAEIARGGFFDPKVQAKIRLLQSGTNHPRFGKHHNKETKEKISKTRIEKQLSNGENNPRSKLTIEKAVQIREKIIADDLKGKDLIKFGSALNLSSFTMKRIRKGTHFAFQKEQER